MDVNAMPIIRLEIDRLKMAVSQAIGTRGSELGELIDQQIDKTLADFPIEEAIKRPFTNR